jgi:hypothetical protein
MLLLQPRHGFGFHKKGVLGAVRVDGERELGAGIAEQPPPRTAGRIVVAQLVDVDEATVPGLAACCPCGSYSTRAR